MKCRRIKVYTSKTLLNCWRRTLEEINAIKAAGGDGLDPHALAEVTDYILDNIDHYREAALPRSAVKASLKVNRLPPIDNGLDNGLSEGVENAR